VIAAPPLWREGLLIGPQHLQQAARAAEERAAALWRALAPHGHGLVELVLDEAALGDGAVRLLRLEAVLPDGTPVRAAGDDLSAALPLARRWPAGAEAATVHLLLPLPGRDGPDVAEGGVAEGRRTRWLPARAELPDQAGGRPREVELLRPNLILALDGEDLSGAAGLPLLRLRRSGDGRWEADSGFAPPCLRLGAAPALAALAGRIQGRLAARLSELLAQRRSRARGLVEFAVADVGAVLAAQAIAGALPELRLLATAGAHPLALHRRLAGLTGELAALAGAAEADAPPPAYDHEAPLTGLAALAERLDALLGGVVHARYLPIPVREVAERIRAGAIPERALTGARLFLAVICDLPAERVIRDVPLRARVAAQGRLDALVAAALPGIRLAYVPVPPPEVPVQPGGAYFELEARGGEWDHALRAQSLAVFLPPELSSARIEFLALLDA
jgi:type VI secretion system protein ImpJ